MDRRRRKTRNSIFSAFTKLLSKKNFSKITVDDIIMTADVGRATFYAHFETKEFLLKELCIELFGHVFNAETGKEYNNGVFSCDAPSSAFLHIFKHVKNNDNNITVLLANDNGDYFMKYFYDGVKGLVLNHVLDFNDKKPKELPDDFWIDHVTSVFIDTLKWWIKNGLKETPETITQFFLLSV